MKRFRLSILLALFVTVMCVVSAQENSQLLPQVIQHDIPIYPPIAKTAHVSGKVRVRIATNGESVTEAVVESGPPLLHKTVEDNVRTWKFAPHTPGTFEATFDFRILANKTTFLKEPGIVEIAVLPPDYNENFSYTLPESWDLELKTATDNIKAPLTTWTYGPWLRGYTLGPRNQERGLGNAFKEGTLLGFDSELNDSHGQVLQFSLVGTKAGREMKGTFLDVWGRSGTWRATPFKRPEPTCAAAPPSAEGNVIPIPEIAQHRQPDYPALPWEAHIQGQVRMRVTTNGMCASKIVAESGEPLLAAEAERNIQTWFFQSQPGTFNLTFNYRLLTDEVSFLETPGVVELFADPVTVGGVGPRSGLWNWGGYSPEVWKARLASPRGHVELTLQFPYGCCEEGSASSPDGAWKEEIKQGHRSENDDEFGFSTTIRIGNNPPARVILIGRGQKGDRIKGIFLDQSGVSGTWSARLVSHGSRNSYL